MDGMGERMRARARDLGWSDAEVARRVGLAQTRYANYVTDRHEPDLATLVRICAVLGASADSLLGIEAPAKASIEKLRRSIAASSRALDVESLAVASTVLDALLAKSPGLAPAPERSGKRGRQATK